MKIDENLHNCNITSCCSKPIHKNCLRDALRAMASRSLCRGNAKEDDASLENEDREDDDRVDDVARICDVLSGQLRQRALDKLNELMRLENIEAAITRVSRAIFSASFIQRRSYIFFFLKIEHAFVCGNSISSGLSRLRSSIKTMDTLNVDCHLCFTFWSDNPNSI